MTGCISCGWGEGNGRTGRAGCAAAGQEIESGAVKKTNLIAISYASDDPQMARESAAIVAEHLSGKAYGGTSSRGTVPLLRAADRRSREARWSESKRRLLRFAALSGSAAAGRSVIWPPETERSGCKLPPDTNRTGRDAAARCGAARPIEGIRSEPRRRCEPPIIQNCSRRSSRACWTCN